MAAPHFPQPQSPDRGYSRPPGIIRAPASEILAPPGPTQELQKNWLDWFRRRQSGQNQSPGRGRSEVLGPKSSVSSSWRDAK
mmetsp:Transcript_54223/g.145167  ORF Transcript_54223/g.145167 Transcript_54223/m.145167 type:complete len:82 (-) Transcript_54223:773-1018(-)